MRMTEVLSIAKADIDLERMKIHIPKAKAGARDQPITEDVAVFLKQYGVDLPTVQRISGHKTLSMVVRYSHQNGEHIQAAMQKLQGRVGSVKAA
jgi:integrase